MIRNPIQYQNQYDLNANKYLLRTNNFTDNLDLGTYLNNNGPLSVLFNYAEYSIDIKNTSTETANNVLDKIVTEI